IVSSARGRPGPGMTRRLWPPDRDQPRDARDGRDAEHHVARGGAGRRLVLRRPLPPRADDEQQHDDERRDGELDCDHAGSAERSSSATAVAINTLITLGERTRSLYGLNVASSTAGFTSTEVTLARCTTSPFTVETRL